ncbi:hypothetical protein G6F65_019893 [Rhizopus arrhizus]|nr:hypothetical protein G6F65_019893 [Rhizopus arrhizus]KAG1386307.1 hypothetical protein G6F58_013856 [Rhizopus delemar]
MGAAAARRAPDVEGTARIERAHGCQRFPVWAGDIVVQRWRWRGKNVEQQLAVHERLSIRLAASRGHAGVAGKAKKR